MEVLPDSSTIIALAKIDSLDLLKETFNTIFITKDVEGEITFGNFSEVREIKRGIGSWIKVIESKTTHYKEFEGLGEGEKSILNYAKERKNVLVILDEAEARALAEEEAIPYTGTIGLIVFAFENGKISLERAVEIIKRLTKSDFRMTVELYDWALEKLK
jgi:predicted nucleic acid-binding protein